MIPDRWYPILETAKLRRRPVGVERLGRRLVLWRDARGAAVAMPAACPHRGASLAQGRVRDGEIACPWHGFRFDARGDCTRMPCEGEDAAPPRAMRALPYPVRERYGLVWLYHREDEAEPRDEAAPLPEIPFFDDLVGSEVRGTSQASYVLPYHYSRMVETNLDLHHSPFVHRAVFPNRPRVDPFEARIEGDRIRSEGTLRAERARTGFDFRVDCLLPNLGFVGLGDDLAIVIAATPVDEQRSWMWFRYYQRHTAFAPLAKAITWIAVQAELRVVQRQDWRIFRELPGGTIDDVASHFVRADQAIALYRRRRRELLEAAGRRVREAV